MLLWEEQEEIAMNSLDKKALRRHLLEARQALSASERAQRDAQILAQLTSLPEVQAARTLLVYLDFKAEVSSHDLIEWALAQGKTVCAPVTVVAERRLIPVRLRSGDDVVSGAYGIREPRLREHLCVVKQARSSSALSQKEVEAIGNPSDIPNEEVLCDLANDVSERVVVPLAHIDVVILPGVGFDREGGRLGYGGGYYDRFLPRLRADACKIAVAYELQILPQVPLEPHDMRLDVLVTEAGVW